MRLKHVGVMGKRNRLNGMSLVEVVISLAIVVLTLSGVFYAYVQMNHMAEWSSMSLAAQSYANQGIERAKAAQWYYQTPYTSGQGTGDELPAVATDAPPVFVEVDTNLIPQTGQILVVTNKIYITTNRPAGGSVVIGPLVRQIRSDVVWTFPSTGKVFTNTAITLRARSQ